MKKIVKAALERTGWELARTSDRDAKTLVDLTPADREIVARVEPFTMTSLERRASLLGAVGGPLSYCAGSQMAGVHLPLGVWPSLLLLGLIWAVLFPLLQGLAHFLRLTRSLRE